MHFSRIRSILALALILVLGQNCKNEDDPFLLLPAIALVSGGGGVGSTNSSAASATSTGSGSTSSTSGNSGSEGSSASSGPQRTIQFINNSPDATGTMSNLVFNGDSVTLPANGFTNSGFVLRGWSTAPWGGGTIYANGSTITGIQSDLVLYAIWELNIIAPNHNGANCSDINSFIPIATRADLENMCNNSGRTFAVGTPHETSVIASGAPLEAGKRNVCSNNSGQRNNYVLLNDIDLSGTDWTTLCGAGGFNARFQGNGFAIRNLNINSPGTDSLGFFANIANNAATRIENLRFEGGTINARQELGTLASRAGNFGLTVRNVSSSVNISGRDTLGGIIGNMDAVNTITLDTIRNSGNITCTLTSIGSCNAGGIVGNAGFFGTGRGLSNTGSILATYTDTNLNIATNVGGIFGTMRGVGGPGVRLSRSWNSGSIIGASRVGGLVGFLDQNNWIVEDSYNRGSVTARIEAAGGIAGRVETSDATSVARRNFSIGTVTSPAHRGGVFGRFVSATPTLTANFWDMATSGVTVSAGSGAGAIEGRSTSDLKNQTTFTGWDFATIWFLDPNQNDGYPSLR